MQKERKRMGKSETPRIISVEPLNGRSLRVDFEDGRIRLFDGYRLRGSKNIPLIDPEIFSAVEVREGDLYWERLNMDVKASYVSRFSVPFDPDYKPEEHIPTRKAVIGERIATVLFPIMAIAGIVGIVMWYIGQ